MRMMVHVCRGVQYLVLMAACIVLQHDEASFKRKAKKSFAASLTEHVPALLAPMTTSHAEALRRYALS